MALIERSDSDAIKIDVLAWFNRMTLDIIGLAGFNHDIDSLSGNSSELADAFTALFKSAMRPTIFLMLQDRFPLLRRVVN